VTAHFGSLTEWATLLSALGTVPTITTVEVVAINTGEARLGVVYAELASSFRTRFPVANSKGLRSRDRQTGGWSVCVPICQGRARRGRHERARLATYPNRADRAQAWLLAPLAAWLNSRRGFRDGRSSCSRTRGLERCGPMAT
jgi:hypothetical protein